MNQTRKHLGRPRVTFSGIGYKAYGAQAKAAPEHMKERYKAVARELFALADQLERTGLVKPRHPEIVKRLPTPSVRQ